MFIHICIFKKVALGLKRVVLEYTNSYFFSVSL